MDTKNFNEKWLSHKIIRQNFAINFTDQQCRAATASDVCFSTHCLQLNLVLNKIKTSVPRRVKFRTYKQYWSTYQLRMTIALRNLGSLNYKMTAVRHQNYLKNSANDFQFFNRFNLISKQQYELKIKSDLIFDLSY